MTFNLNTIDWSAMSTLALILTFGAILWYSYETQKLKRIAYQQLQIQVAPILIIYFRENPSRITVRNIGNGPALNVEFEKIFFPLSEGQKTEFTLKIDDPPTLIPGEERSVMGSMMINGKTIFEDFPKKGSTVWIEPKYAELDIEFAIIYSDMRNEKYESKVLTGKDKIKLLNYKQIKESKKN